MININPFILLNNNLSIESESDEEEMEELELLYIIKQYLSKDKHKPTRIIQYFEAVVPNYNQREFQSHFRMTCEAFEALLAKIGPSLRNNTTGRPTNNESKQLLAVM